MKYQKPIFKNKKPSFSSNQHAFMFGFSFYASSHTIKQQLCSALTMEQNVVLFVFIPRTFPSKKVKYFRDVYRDEKWSKCDRILKLFMLWNHYLIKFLRNARTCLFVNFYTLYILKFISETLTAVNSLSIVELQSFLLLWFDLIFKKFQIFCFCNLRFSVS